MFITEMFNSILSFLMKATLVYRRFSAAVLANPQKQPTGTQVAL